MRRTSSKTKSFQSRQEAGGIRASERDRKTQTSRGVVTETWRSLRAV